MKLEYLSHEHKETHILVNVKAHYLFGVITIDKQYKYHLPQNIWSCGNIVVEHVRERLAIDAIRMAFCSNKDERPHKSLHRGF